MSIKVCIVTFEYPPLVGGVGQSVCRIASMLGEKDFEIHIAFLRKDTTNFDIDVRRTYRTSSEQGKVTVHHIYPLIKQNSSSNAEYYLEASNQIKSLHNKYNFDIFHGFYISESGFLTTMIAKEVNRPVICSIRGSDIKRDIFQKANSHIMWALANADMLTFVSAELMNLAEILVRGIKNKSKIIWNSVSPLEFDNLETPIQFTTMQRPVIGALGQFRQKKGVEFLIEACEKISIPSYTLFLIGDFKEVEKEFWQMELNASRIKDKVVLTGLLPHKQALACLKQVDIFVLPSINEGCPNALLEAMMTEKPIVATRVGAVQEILENHIDAILVHPESSLEIAQALEKIVCDPVLAKSLGANAKKKAFSALSPQVELTNWENCYRELLTGSTAERD